jgi:hypothetical protein
MREINRPQITLMPPSKNESPLFLNLRNLCNLRIRFEDF